MKVRSGNSRIGGVLYGVGAPLLCGLDQDPEVDFVHDTPATLIRSLRKGELDAALASSIEAFRHPGYRILPDLGIASRGPARSVRAFKRSEPIRTVGLDHGSATSSTLLQIFLQKGILGEVAPDIEFSKIVPTDTPDDLPQDLVMMIGDRGLDARPGNRTVIDLGAEWERLTGLPFVYALWMIRPGADAEALAARLYRARDDSIAEGITDGTGGAIYYDLGEDELAGLRRFHAEAARLDLADPTLQLQLLEAR